MKKTARMTYMGPVGGLGPSDILDDPVSGLRWSKGETLEVDMEVAQRLLLDPSAEWETDAPRPEPAPEPPRGWPYVQMPVPGSDASGTPVAPGTDASGAFKSEETTAESAVEIVEPEAVPGDGET